MSEHPTAPQAPATSTPEQIDASLETLAHNKDAWAAMGIDTVQEILAEVRRDVDATGEEWVRACTAAKGIAASRDGVGEEWIIFSIAERMLRLLEQSLADIKRHDAPQLPKPLRVNDHGHVVADVFPASTLDKFTFQGMSAEVWMRSGDTIEETLATQATAYKLGAAGKVSLVLGAGNVSALVPADILHKLFVERAVVALKPNPVNEYLGPIIEKGFRALIDRGFLRVIYGGVREGQYACYHDLVDEVHMTGSEKTFEAIVFGSGDEGKARKTKHDPILRKPVTAELGTIGPIIVVPGPWSEKEVKRQGSKLAWWLINNAGFNCLTPRLVIQQQQWDRRGALNESIRKGLAGFDTRPAYYPGAQGRHAAFVEAYPQAWQIGSPAPGELPWTYITEVDANDPDEMAFQSESFCGLMCETALDAEGVTDYLAQAVQFVNNQVWGTLVAMIVVHPDSLKDPAIGAAVEQAIDDLRCGTVLLNTFPGLGYLLGTVPWGSYPGQDIYDIQSGIGWVNNYLMFAHPEKSVIRGPFLQSPDVYSPSFSKMDEFGRKLAALQADPGYGKLTSLVWTVMTG